MIKFPIEFPIGIEEPEQPSDDAQKLKILATFCKKDAIAASEFYKNNSAFVEKCFHLKDCEPMTLNYKPGDKVLLPNGNTLICVGRKTSRLKRWLRALKKLLRLQ